MLRREQLWPNARTRSMAPDANAGVSNYYLPVYVPECREPHCAPELLLWFDSRGGFYHQQRNEDGSLRPQPDWVDASVAAWFEATW